jgi:hypothetical protein
MLKQKIGDLSARLLRAAIGRIVNDLELVDQTQATMSSTMLIDLAARIAKAYGTRQEGKSIVQTAARYVLGLESAASMLLCVAKEAKVLKRRLSRAVVVAALAWVGDTLRPPSFGGEK